MTFPRYRRFAVFRELTVSEQPSRWSITLVSINQAKGLGIKSYRSEAAIEAAVESQFASSLAKYRHTMSSTQSNPSRHHCPKHPSTYLESPIDQFCNMASFVFASLNGMGYTGVWTLVTLWCRGCHDEFDARSRLLVQ